MDFSEYLRRLGAEPRSAAEDLRRARDSGPEFRQAAESAERFEQRLEQALDLPVPPDLAASLRNLPDRAARGRTVRFGWPAALAAGLLLAAGAWVLQARLFPRWDSVESYLEAHYRHDGPEILERAGEEVPPELRDLLADFGVSAAPALADSVRLVKHCPTPHGQGLHLVLDSPQGLVTVIYMPKTAVQDGETLRFDGREALLVALPKGSAAIIGTPAQQVAGLYPLLHESIRPDASDSG